ncbi:MAG: CshA/CshB family fibrillar adhesin-related protein [Cellulosilyticaceae bacterium]
MMASLNGTAEYSTPGTGKYADYIAWLDFEASTNLLSVGPVTVHNDIPGGYTIDFDLEAAAIDSTQPIKTAVTATPNQNTYGALGKGTAYGGIENLYFSISMTNTKVKLSNIIVKKNGIPTQEYMMVVADAEITTSGEEWSIASNGPVWDILDSVPQANPVESPTLSGVGSSKVTLTGVNYNTTEYIFNSYQTQEIEINVPSGYPAGLVAAFGIMVKIPPAIKKEPVITPIENKKDNYASFIATFTPTDSTQVKYILTDTISPATGLAYIPTTAGTNPKSSVKQGANAVPVIESTVANVTTFEIAGADLVMNEVVTLTLVYQLEQTLNADVIDNVISIATEDANQVLSPSISDDAKIALEKIAKPLVTKGPVTQEVLIEKGAPINFTITASNLQEDPATNEYVISDTLHPALTFDPANTTVEVIDNGVITPLALDYTIGPNNTLLVKIPAADVPVTATIRVKVSTIIDKVELLSPGQSFDNIATLIIDGDAAKTYDSNPAEVLFINRCYQAYTDLIESVALGEAALANILQQEGAKIQASVKLATTSEELLCINRSVDSMVKSMITLEAILVNKLSMADRCQKISRKCKA